MKKLIIVGLTVLFLTGCGMSKEEKESMLLNSLEKAYISIYSSDGVGLAVYGDKTVEIDGKVWYEVAETKYDRIDKITELADQVYESKVSDQVKKKINEKYKETDTKLYTLSEGGCKLSYDLSDELQSKLKSDIKITKYGSSKIVFEYKGKEYTAKKSKDNYVFDDKIFACVED